MTKLSDPLRDVLIGVLILVVAAAVAAFAGLPTRVSVVEVQQVGFKDSLQSMDRKLDSILEKMAR